MTKDVISGITKDSYFEAFLNAKSNKYTDMNIEKIHVMLYNTMEQISNGEVVQSPSQSYMSDSIITLEGDGITYILNQYGYRFNNFNGNPDILTLGCSVTAGAGLPLEETWAYRVSKETGLSYESIAVNGDSVFGQIRKAHAYIKKLGKPKIIMALFPDFRRFESISNPNHFKTSRADSWEKKYIADFPNNPNYRLAYAHSAHVEGYRKTKQLFKTPLLIDEVVTPEISFFYSSQAIHMFSEYCKEAGIKFIWSTWDSQTAEMIKKYKTDEYFNEYIDIKTDTWMLDGENLKDILFSESLFNKMPESFLGDPIENIEKWHIESFASVDCDHKEEMLKDYYHIAMDREMGIRSTHFGSHRHIHYSDFFINSLKEYMNAS
jgi:hypothetical protein